jgi:predicted  nucleic acid-binding Zn-ribbon protein
MKFEKLVRLVSESGFRPNSNKSQGGNRFHRAQTASGPAQFSSSSVGKNDNPETQTPMSRWEFDPSLMSGKSGAATESKLWKSMMGSIGLLLNDDFFDKQVKKIGKVFDAGLDSYKNIKGFDEDGAPVKYDEENQLEKLERNQTKYRSDLEGFRQQLKDLDVVINRTKLSPSEKNAMFTKIGELEGRANSLRKLIKKDPKRKAQFDTEIGELTQRIDKLTDKYSQATMKPAELEKIKSTYFDLETKFEDRTKKLEKTTEELEALYERINTINTKNETANEKAVNGFVDLVKYTAKQLADEHRSKLNTPVNVNSLSQINWDDVNPQKVQDNIARLDALASDDENINPVLGYLERFKRQYEDVDFDAGKALDKNVNISKMRDRNRLPFMVLLRIYNSLNLKKAFQIDSGIESDEHKDSYGELKNYIDSKKTTSADSVTSWNNPAEKQKLQTMIMGLALPTQSKNNIISMLSRPWSVSRSGFNNYSQLLSSIDADLKRFKPRNESFDSFASRILIENHYDIDDFMIDTMEILNSIKRPKY